MRLFLLCIIFCWARQTVAQQLIRGPYLMMNSPHSIVVHWYTDIPTNSVVKYGTDSNSLTNMVATISTFTHHQLAITNLQPNTIYYYQVGHALQSFVTGSKFHFKTQPLTQATYSQPLTFWTMGDMGKQTLLQQRVRDMYLKIKDSIHVNGFILLGDNAYESGLDSEYQLGFFNYYQQDILCNTTVYPCLGNHDYANNYTLRTNHQIPYFDIFTNPMQAECGGVPSFSEAYYAYNVGNVHFIHLDSYGLEEVNGNYYALADTLYSPQVQWLKSDLQQNVLPWTIVCFHHPPYCMGTHNSDAESDLVAIRTQLLPILERYNVDLVLNGHSHAYERSFLIKDHFGLSATFDSNIHRRQLTDGSYTSGNGHCAYSKHIPAFAAADSGTVYAVVGSGSAFPVVPFPEWPHPAMAYANENDNGSLLFTVWGNRLDAQFISIDSTNIIKDRFTIVKNVNRSDTIWTNFPDTLYLEADWQASSYAWSTGDTTKQITHIVTHDTTITVFDIQHCWMHQFVVRQGIPTLQQYNQTSQSAVYPNPFHDYININSQHNPLQQIDVFDYMGRMVYRYPLAHHEIVEKLNLQDLPRQQYYIIQTITDKNQLYRYLIYKQ